MRLAIVLGAINTTAVAAFSICKIDIGKVAQASAVAGVIATASADNAYARGDVAAGEQIFNSNCAVCHAGGQNVIMPQKTLQKEALEQYLAGGRTEKAVIYQVTNGKNAMPSFS